MSEKPVFYRGLYRPRDLPNAKPGALLFAVATRRFWKLTQDGWQKTNEWLGKTPSDAELEEIVKLETEDEMNEQQFMRARIEAEAMHRRIDSDRFQQRLMLAVVYGVVTATMLAWMLK